MNKVKAVMLLAVVALAVMLGGAGTVLASGNGEGSYGSGHGNGEYLGHSGEGNCTGGYGAHGFWANLTDAQRDDIIEKVEAMRDEGASWEEIKAEISAMLQEWGIDVSAWEGLHNGEHEGSGCQGHGGAETTETIGLIAGAMGIPAIVGTAFFLRRRKLKA